MKLITMKSANLQTKHKEKLLRRKNIKAEFNSLNELEQQACKHIFKYIQQSINFGSYSVTVPIITTKHMSGPLEFMNKLISYNVDHLKTLLLRLGYDCITQVETGTLLMVISWSNKSKSSLIPR